MVSIDTAAVLAGALDNHHRARVLAVSAPHAGDWLYALPISNCGLRLDDGTIRVAVGLRFGINLWQPHPCCCGTLVDCRDTHGLARKLSSGRQARHRPINDLVGRYPVHQTGRYPVHQGTCRAFKIRRQTPGRSHPHTLTGRQEPNLGCYCS